MPTHAPAAALTAVDATTTRTRSTLALYAELAKVRLTALVLLTTLVGFVMAAHDGVDGSTLLLTLAGTALAAFGANALNQCIEMHRDGLMLRTRHRPLPSRQLRRSHAVVFGFTTALAGPAVLAELVNPLSGALALLTIALYVIVYTPLKVHSQLNTLVGAVVGAIPPMIGWAGAAGTLETGAWVLGAILFVWQIPHFLALAWMYRADYARGGYRMLPVIDPRGEFTCVVILLYSLVLLPLGLMLVLAGLAGWYYALGGLVLGGGLVWCGVMLQRNRGDTHARRLFLASVLYLPLLLGLLVADRRVPGSFGVGTPPPTRLAAAVERAGLPGGAAR